MITSLHHAQFRVPAEKEKEAIHFYEEILGLERIPKAKKLQKNGGAWFKVNENQQVHISLEEIDNNNSKRHLCFQVDDLEKAKLRLESYGVKIILDKQPVEKWIRFYFRDPGGNRLEIAQKK